MTVRSPLLSLEESRARSRPLRSWASKDRALVAERVGGAFQAWRDAWALDATEVSVVAASSCELVGVDARSDPSTWESAPSCPGLWWSVSGGSRGKAGAAAATAELLLALFGGRDERFRSSTTSAEGGIAPEVVDASWRDLWARFSAALAGTTPAQLSPERALVPWSGALVAQLPWWGCQLSLLLGAEVVERVVPAAPPRAPPPARPIEPIWRAISERRFEVRAELEACELTLGELASMRPGHVIGTLHALEQPLELTICAGDQEPVTACAGFLGKLGDLRAIELVGSK